jgi:hypothetical protein
MPAIMGGNAVRIYRPDKFKAGKFKAGRHTNA